MDRRNRLVTIALWGALVSVVFLGVVDAYIAIGNATDSPVAGFGGNDPKGPLVLLQIGAVLFAAFLALACVATAIHRRDRRRPENEAGETGQE